MTSPDPRREQYAGAITDHLWGSPEDIDEATSSVMELADHERRSTEAERDEARQWARHGYEIGQRHCGWSDHGVAPAWLTEGWPPHIDSCEHLAQMAEFDMALARVRALAERWRYTGDRKHGPLTELLAALGEPAPAATEATDGERCCGKPSGAVCVHDIIPPADQTPEA